MQGVIYKRAFPELAPIFVADFLEFLQWYHSCFFRAWTFAIPKKQNWRKWGKRWRFLKQEDEFTFKLPMIFFRSYKTLKRFLVQRVLKICLLIKAKVFITNWHWAALKHLWIRETVKIGQHVCMKHYDKDKNNHVRLPRAFFYSKNLNEDKFEPEAKISAEYVL